jgi:hypothetical protein
MFGAQSLIVSDTEIGAVAAGLPSLAIPAAVSLQPGPPTALQRPPSAGPLRAPPLGGGSRPQPPGGSMKPTGTRVWPSTASEPWGEAGTTNGRGGVLHPGTTGIFTDDVDPVSRRIRPSETCKTSSFPERFLPRVEGFAIECLVTLD